MYSAEPTYSKICWPLTLGPRNYLINFLSILLNQDNLFIICTTPQMNVQQEHTETQPCLAVLVVMITLSVLQEHLLVLLVMLEL